MLRGIQATVSPQVSVLLPKRGAGEGKFRDEFFRGNEGFTKQVEMERIFLALHVQENEKCQV